jgi:5-methylcytosine-specific restriction endonuclease McrA
VLEWREILEYFDYRCAYCLRDDVELTLDHVIAISRGGGHTKENVVPACKSHNSKKHDRPVFLMVA